MNKKITIMLIALMSFTSKSYGAASAAAQEAIAAQAATDQVGVTAADLEDADIQPSRIEGRYAVFESPDIPGFSIYFFDANDSKLTFNDFEIKYGHKASVKEFFENIFMTLITNKDSVNFMENYESYIRKCFVFAIKALHIHDDFLKNNILHAIKIAFKNAIEKVIIKIERDFNVVRNVKGLQQSENELLLSQLKELQKTITFQMLKIDLFLKFYFESYNPECKNQTQLKMKIILFLMNELNIVNIGPDSHKKDILYRKEAIIKLFNFSGFCVGLTTLFLFGILTEEGAIARLEFEKLHSLKKAEDQAELKNNDRAWFDAAQNLLFNWDGKTKFDDGEKQLLYFFISAVIQFQEYSHIIFPEYATLKNLQLDLAVTLENQDGKRGILKNHIFLKHPTEAALIDALRGMLESGSMMFFEADVFEKTSLLDDLFKYSGKHVVGFYRSILDPNLVYFYDANNETGKHFEFNIKDLAAFVNTNLACKFGFVPDGLKSVKIDVFDFPESQ